MTRSPRPGTLARLYTALIAAALTLPAAGRDASPAAAAASAPDYSGVRYGPMSKLRCPDGEYRGPEQGKKVWTQDDYTWAVTRDFAERFCMPESMISDELGGAEAVAYRLKPSDEATRRLEGGQEVCRHKAELQLELYIRSHLGLPKSHPEVQFYQAWWSEASSGSIIKTNQGLKRHYRRHAGAWTDPPGRTPPFNANEDKRTKFVYLNFADKDAPHFVSNLYETYYQANWVDDMDLVRLEPSGALGLGMLSDERVKLPSRRFGIGLIRERDFRHGREGGAKLTRDRYAHVVDLPSRISDLIFAYDKQQGELFINAAKRALGVPGTPATPQDMEPLVPPLTR